MDTSHAKHASTPGQRIAQHQNIPQILRIVSGGSPTAVGNQRDYLPTYLPTYQASVEDGASNIPPEVDFELLDGWTGKEKGRISNVRASRPDIPILPLQQSQRCLENTTYCTK